MMKILTLHFSQSGQLTDILTNFSSPFKDAEFDYQMIVPSKSYPFPWDVPTFFDTMPNSVLEIPCEIEPIQYKHEKYDLIIIGYQPWFLSPSIPITSLLKDATFQKIVEDTPVITLIGSRNMWLNSQESVKMMIANAGGQLVGNVALADRGDNLIGVITILHWMLTGKKTKKWGILPKPGVSDEDIEQVKIYGELAQSAFEQNDLEHLQAKIASKGGVEIRTNILFIERKAKRLFIIWANLIQKKSKQGKRKFWVNAFKYYLIFVLFVVSPILLLFYTILIYPFSFKKVQKRKTYYQGVDLQ
ncbi:MAG: hypothetical protein M9916_09520 [Crocinitomicaceae bacterium]|nr:hypothetical protein [Crocinitomicaceae bacterium]